MTARRLLLPATTAPIGAMILVLLSGIAKASLPLEAESARVMNPGMVKIETAFVGQTSPDGREMAVPIAIEYAITCYIELQIEPVPVTAILPASGVHATGFGDLEATAREGRR